jgi:hypothetical protein
MPMHNISYHTILFQFQLKTSSCSICLVLQWIQPQVFCLVLQWIQQQVFFDDLYYLYNQMSHKQDNSTIVNNNCALQNQQLKLHQ